MRIRGKTGDFGARPAYQTAVVRTNKPDSPAPFDAQGSYVSTNSDNYDDVDLTSVTDSKFFIRFGIQYKITSTSVGSADVSLQVSYRAKGMMGAPSRRSCWRLVHFLSSVRPSRAGCLPWRLVRSMWLMCLLTQIPNLSIGLPTRRRSLLLRHQGTGPPWAVGGLQAMMRTISTTLRPPPQTKCGFGLESCVGARSETRTSRGMCLLSWPRAGRAASLVESGPIWRLP